MFVFEGILTWTRLDGLIAGETMCAVAEMTKNGCTNQTELLYSMWPSVIYLLWKDGTKIKFLIGQYPWRQ